MWLVRDRWLFCHRPSKNIALTFKDKFISPVSAPSFPLEFQTTSCQDICLKRTIIQKSFIFDTSFLLLRRTPSWVVKLSFSGSCLTSLYHVTSKIENSLFVFTNVYPCADVALSNLYLDNMIMIKMMMTMINFAVNSKEELTCYIKHDFVSSNW